MHFMYSVQRVAACCSVLHSDCSVHALHVQCTCNSSTLFIENSLYLQSNYTILHVVIAIILHDCTCDYMLHVQYTCNSSTLFIEYSLYLQSYYTIIRVITCCIYIVRVIHCTCDSFIDHM